MNRAIGINILLLFVNAVEAQSISTDPGIWRESPPRIGVRVYNLAEAPDRVLETAQAKAAEVLRSAGIESEWFVCPLSPEEQTATEECMAASGPATLVLKLAPNEVAKQFYASKHSLGFALLSDRGRPTSDAWVFYERVGAQAQDGGCYMPTILGYAIAHEIGHLLLGEGSHTSSGLMKGFWGKRELRKAEVGELRFSEKQTRRMQAQIRERYQLGRLSARRK